MIRRTAARSPVGHHPDRDPDLDPDHGGRHDLARHALPARPDPAAERAAADRGRRTSSSRRSPTSGRGTSCPSRRSSNPLRQPVVPDQPRLRRYDPFLVRHPVVSGADWGRHLRHHWRANQIGLPGRGPAGRLRPALAGRHRGATRTPAQRRTTPEGRFGSGIGFLRTDPSGGLAERPRAPAAHQLPGLRSRRFPASFNAAYAMLVQQNYVTVLETFVSPEDLIMQDSTGKYNDPTGRRLPVASPIVPDCAPDLSGGVVPRTTGGSPGCSPASRATRPTASIFDGDIVICENRPFGLDTGQPRAAVHDVSRSRARRSSRRSGATSTDSRSSIGGNLGYGSRSGSRPACSAGRPRMPDPDVKVGGWIADVTYERTAIRRPRSARHRPVHRHVSRPALLLVPDRQADGAADGRRSRTSPARLPPDDRLDDHRRCRRRR